jgi:hypothetical protein
LQVPRMRRPPTSSEQGKTLFASGEFIGRRSRKHRAGDMTKCCHYCWFALRILLLTCCRAEPNSNTSWRKVVVLRRRPLNTTQGKVVLRTAARLPSDKTHAPHLHTLFLRTFCASPPNSTPPSFARPPCSRQHQNPSRPSLLTAPLASFFSLLLRPLPPRGSNCFFSKPEGRFQQYPNPQKKSECGRSKGVAATWSPNSNKQ